MNELVVKNNVLIQSSYSLTLVETRLILMAIAGARETGLGVTTETFLEISALEYAKHFNVEKHTAYETLSDAVLTLFNRQVTLYDTYKGMPDRIMVRWVSGISYIKNLGMVRIRFTPEVIPLITRLETNFTSYELIQVVGLKSVYAMRLYELLMQWKLVERTPELKLAEFRNQMGLLDGQYADMSDLKKYVVNIAIKQINEHTDILVELEQIKNGRSISGFIFTFIKKRLKIKAIKQSTNIKKRVKPKIQRYPLSGLAEMNFKRLKEAFPEITLNELYDIAEKDGETIEITIQQMLPIKNILPSFIKQIEPEHQQDDTADMFDIP